MKYLMTYQNGKKPLRFSKQVSGFAIDAGSLGKVYPVLVPVDSTDSAKSSLRIKLNNQIKAFTTIPSVILPGTLLAKTGNTLEDPQGFAHSYDVNVIRKIQYNEYEGLFFCVGKYFSAPGDISPTVEVKFSMDGVHWNYHPFDTNWEGTLRYISYNQHGFIFITDIMDFSEFDKTGDVSHYLGIYVGKNGRLVEARFYLMEKNYCRKWEDAYKKYFVNAVNDPESDTILLSYYNYAWGDYTKPMNTQIYGVVIDHPSQTTCVANFYKHDQMPYERTSYGHTTIITPSFFFSSKDKAYNYWNGYNDGDWSYNVIDWYKTEPYPRENDKGQVGDYTILSYDKTYEKTVMTKDGGQTTITVNKIVCGFDPVDKTYLSQDIELESSGTGFDVVIAKIYASSDLNTWTLLKTINYGKSPYWASDFRCAEALDTYAALGFTD